MINIELNGELKSTEVSPIKSEVMTSHKITIVILIREYNQYRNTADSTITEEAAIGCKHRRDFSLLILKLLQSPDINLNELQNILKSSRYKLHEEVFRLFNDTLSRIYRNGTDTLLDIIKGLNQLLAPSDLSTSPVQTTYISRSSIVGYFLRRFIVNFDTLTFSEVTNVILTFKTYYKKWKNTNDCSTMRTVEVDKATDDWSVNGAQWSRRQAELFIATQAALLTENEEKALSPIELQNRISSLLHSNPSLSEAHFLSYMNCLRVKEFCGAIDSLYHCFDRSTLSDKKAAVEKKNTVHRFAALNLAILHYNFGNKEEALASLKESIKVSQAVNDHVCLQHALAWLYRITDINKDELIEHSITKSSELKLSYTSLLALQTYVKYGLDEPDRFFEILLINDIMNSQNNLRDLVSNSYALKAALWQFYGKPDMCSLWSQLLLYLNVDIYNSKAFYCEGFCIAVCNIANYLLMQGHYALVNTIFGFIKDRFPNEPNSHIWMLCENLLFFVRALHHEDFGDAESAAQKILVINKWEGYLRLAELYLHKQDYKEANRFIEIVLNRYKNAEKHKLKKQYYIRAKILLADVQVASCGPDSAPPGILTLLNDCLIEAYTFKLNYYSNMIYLRLANVQLGMGMCGQALEILDNVVVQVLAHCGSFDRGRAMLLYVKCLIADSGQLNADERRDVMMGCIGMLEGVRACFQEVEAFSRVKDVVFFEAQLYNELGMKNERNECARVYRGMEEERGTKNFYTLVKYL